MPKKSPVKRNPGFPVQGIGKTLGALFRSRRLEFCPLVDILRHYTAEEARADFRAGVKVALGGFPQGIAFAMIAGLPPQYGLISVGLGAAVGAIFSGSRLVVMGPGNSTAILLFSGMMSVGFSEEQRIIALPLFIFMVGCFQLIGSLTNMSLVLNYVSRTVVTAYITAAAALIIVNQIQNLLGFSVEESSTFVSILVGTLSNLDQARLPEILMGLSALVTMALMRRCCASMLPDAAITLVLMGLLALYFQWAGWEVSLLNAFTVDSLDVFALTFSLDMMGQLAAPAFAVAFLGVVEGASVGRSLASQSGERINVNQVMYGMGLANLANSLFGGMDASGSVTRSALNWSSGARTGVSVVFSGIIGLALLFSIGFLIAYIPLSALSAVVLTVAFSLFNSRQVCVSLKTTRADAGVFITTLLAALLFTLDTAIYIGVFISILLFLRKVGVPELVEYTFNEEGQLAELQKPGGKEAPGISILHVEGDLFFGSTELFVEQARQAMINTSIKVVILRLKNARHLDATCAIAIEELLQLLHANDCHLIVSGATREIFRVFRNSGLLDKLGRENFFMHIPSNPAYSTRNALKRAQELLGEQEAEIRIFVDKQRQDQKEEVGEPSPSDSG